jgi:uncharacterized protein YegL
MPIEAMDGPAIGQIHDIKEFEQLAVPVMDGSDSMSDIGETGQTKADEADVATRTFVGRMQHSRHVDNFFLAGVSFSHKVTPDFIPLQPMAEVDETGDYNPLDPQGQGTAMGDALATAREIAEEFLATSSEFPRSAVIILMTDGMNNHGQDPLKIAEEIKQNEQIVLCAAGYGKGSGIDDLTLQKIVSRPDCYVRAYNPEELRKFFEASATSRLEV